MHVTGVIKSSRKAAGLLNFCKSHSGSCSSYVCAETTVLANDLKSEGFKVVSLYPGEVDTVMWKHLADTVFTEANKATPGWRRPDLTPQQSVQAMLRVILHLTTADSGKFFRYDGSEMSW